MENFKYDFDFGNTLDNGTSFSELLNGELNAQNIEVSNLSNALTCRHRHELN